MVAQMRVRKDVTKMSCPRCRPGEGKAPRIAHLNDCGVGPVQGAAEGPLEGLTAEVTMPGMVTIIDNRPLRHPEKARKPDTPLLRKPDWIRVRMPTASAEFAKTQRIVREHGLHTVCEEAACPNLGECWQQRTGTMTIMGDIGTRTSALCKGS